MSLSSFRVLVTLDGDLLMQLYHKTAVDIQAPVLHQKYGD